jgi:hypothetical protein
MLYNGSNPRRGHGLRVAFPFGTETLRLFLRVGIRCRSHLIHPVVERQRHHRSRPQKKRIPKGCQRRIRVCDNAPGACWHPVGMHSNLRGNPVVSLALKHWLSCLRHDRRLPEREHDQETEARCSCACSCLLHTRASCWEPWREQATRIVERVVPHSAPDNDGYPQENLSHPMKVAGSLSGTFSQQASSPM